MNAAMARYGSGNAKAAAALVDLFLSLPLPAQVGIVAAGATGAAGFMYVQHKDIEKRPAMVQPMVKNAIDICKNSGIEDWNGGNEYGKKLTPVLMKAWTHSLQKIKDNHVHVCLNPSLNGISAAYDYNSWGYRYHGDRSVAAVFRTEADGERVLSFKVLPAQATQKISGVDLNYSPGRAIDMTEERIAAAKKARMEFTAQVQVLIRQEGQKCERTGDRDCWDDSGYFWAEGKDYEDLKAKYPSMFESPIRPKLVKVAAPVPAPAQ